MDVIELAVQRMHSFYMFKTGKSDWDKGAKVNVPPFWLQRITLTGTQCILQQLAFVSDS